MNNGGYKSHGQDKSKKFTFHKSSDELVTKTETAVYAGSCVVSANSSDNPKSSPLGEFRMPENGHTGRTEGTLDVGRIAFEELHRGFGAGFNVQLLVNVFQ